MKVHYTREVLTVRKLKAVLAQFPNDEAEIVLAFGAHREFKESLASNDQGEDWPFSITESLDGKEVIFFAEYS